MTRDEVFEKLAELGIVKVALRFYGGNDEGYIEDAEFDAAEGMELSVGQFSPDQEFKDALEEPIWGRYDGFAGDFSVSGNIYWDVSKRTVTMIKSETEWIESEELV